MSLARGPWLASSSHRLLPQSGLAELGDEVLRERLYAGVDGSAIFEGALGVLVAVGEDVLLELLTPNNDARPEDDRPASRRLQQLVRASSYNGNCLLAFHVRPR